MNWHCTWVYTGINIDSNSRFCWQNQNQVGIFHSHQYAGAGEKCIARPPPRPRVGEVWIGLDSQWVRWFENWMALKCSFNTFCVFQELIHAVRRLRYSGARPDDRSAHERPGRVRDGVLQELLLVGPERCLQCTLHCLYFFCLFLLVNSSTIYVTSCIGLILAW